jgi:four helix bundle protein
MNDKIKHFRELNVYNSAKAVALEVYALSKKFPPEEKYSLTDQIRRSSRSVCANLAEAWRKRRYTAAFISKLNDCEAECSETQVWLEFSKEFGFINVDTFTRLDSECDRIIAMLVKMSLQVDRWTYEVKEDVAEYEDGRPEDQTARRPE